MTEIRNALAAGKEVITHTDAVSVPGWSGAGYIITDPDTGAGAYKIAGGGNGSYISMDEFIGCWAGIFLGLATFSFLAMWAFASLLLFIPFLLSLAIAYALFELTINDAEYWTGAGVGFGFFYSIVEFSLVAVLGLILSTLSMVK
jgi:hypothetical protein